MAKKQTRRAISLNRGVYDRLRAHCEARGVSIASTAQAVLERWLNSQTDAPQVELCGECDGKGRVVRHG